MSVPPLPELRCVPADESTTLGLSRNEQTRWFAEEVELPGGQLKAYLRSAYPTVRDVDDLVQESYLRIWRRHLVRPISSAKRFLFKVARHLAIDAVRHERTAPIDDVIEFAGLSVVEDRNMAKALAPCLERLPAANRPALA